MFIKIPFLINLFINKPLNSEDGIKSFNGLFTIRVIHCLNVLLPLNSIKVHLVKTGQNHGKHLRKAHNIKSNNMEAVEEIFAYAL
jgi:hypothetical protein